MKAPAIPRDERERLRALADYTVLDTTAEPAFDAITQLVATILEVPIALISLVDADRQWFKARYGLDAPQTAREVSFCGHVVADGVGLIVNDAWRDERFADNPLVTGAPHVRFYAGMPLRTPDGFVLGTLCAIDNQERQLSEVQMRSLQLLARQVVDLLELRRHSRLLREFKGTLDGTPDGIFIFAPDSLRFRYANRGAQLQTGYSAHELLRMTPLQLKRDLDEANYRRKLEPLINGEQSTILFEAVHVHKQGHKVPVEVMLQYVARDGETPHFINIARDISERKRLDELKDQFIATVSHELRTPLTSIRGSLGLVSGGVTGELSAQTKEYVDLALSNTDRLMRLVNDLLDIEKVQSETFALELRPLTLSKVLHGVLNSSQALAQSLGIELVLLGDGVDAEVLGDPDRVTQVTHNLVSNALKFSSSGQRVELSVSARPGRLRAEVRDHGEGVPDSFRGRIFQRFAQADGSSGRRRGGSGLGLSISKALIEAMHGEIGFSANPEGGSTFFFELPLATTTVEARRSTRPSEGRR